MSRAVDTLNWLSAWAGTSETEDNGQPFSAFAGLPDHEEWCAILQVAAAKSTGEAIPAGGVSAYTPTRYSAYLRAGLVIPLAHVQPGDIGWVQYDSMRSTRLLGIGHEVRFVTAPGASVATIEGNANAAASRTGGQVARLYRSMSGGKTSRLIAAARPAWDGAKSTLRNLPPHPALDTSTLPVVYADAVAHTTTKPTGQLTVDGNWGEATTRALQRWLGVSADGNLGPVTVRALQARLNALVGAKLTADGKMGPATIRALQAWLGTPRDGKLSTPVSACVRALQARLNGTLSA